MSYPPPPPPHGRPATHIACALVLAVTALGAPAVSLARPEQCATDSCTWTATDVPVWFNPGVLSARGLDPTEFRDRLRQALQVWNEEGASNLRLYYAGDTYAPSITGALVVYHADSYDCENMNAAAYGTWGWVGESCDAEAHWIVVNIYNECFDQYYDIQPYLTAGSENSYEGVLVHEIGHAVFKLGHDLQSNGYTDLSVMEENTADARELLLLYEDDRNCLQFHREGATTFDQATIRTTDGGGSLWSTAVKTTLGLESTLGPGLHQDDTSQTLLAGQNSHWRFLAVGRGTHMSGWTAWNGPPNGATISGIENWSAIVQGHYGDTLVVWLDDCRNSLGGCKIKWAWTGASSDGSSWLTGTFDGHTPMRPMVGYDKAEDRFVVAVLGTDHRVYTRNAPSLMDSAWTGWAATAFSVRFRYTGGLTFDQNGGGLMTAAIDYPGYPAGLIMQVPMTRNSSGNYLLAVPHKANDVTPNNFRTARHFDHARRHGSGSQQIMLVWRDAAEDCWQGRGLMYSAVKTSILPGDDFGSRVSSGRCVFSSVSVAAEPSVDHFVAGIVQP